MRRRDTRQEGPHGTHSPHSTASHFNPPNQAAARGYPPGDCDELGDLVGAGQGPRGRGAVGQASRGAGEGCGTAGRCGGRKCNVHQRRHFWATCRQYGGRLIGALEAKQPPGQHCQLVGGQTTAQLPPGMPAMCSHIARGAGAPAACDTARSSSTMPWRSCMVCKIRPRSCCQPQMPSSFFWGGLALHRLDTGDLRDQGRRVVKQGLHRRATLDKRRISRALQVERPAIDRSTRPPREAGASSQPPHHCRRSLHRARGPRPPPDSELIKSGKGFLEAGAGSHQQRCCM